MKRMFTYLLLCFAALPFMDCSPSHCSTNDTVFEYREIYLPCRNDPEMKQLRLDNLDTDWGLWGHNLARVLPKNPSRTVFATIDGRSNDEQFCFSSDVLFKYVVDYISDNYDEHDPQRFAILPNDNSLVCQCEQCRAKGCTASNATPAVQDMLERLAKRFPKHIFFTSSYLTTRSIPSKPMPENTGVLISAMDYDLCAKATPQEEAFRRLLAKWSSITKHVYVWDYINNFDDYITPFPIFNVMQRRFKFYKEAGVCGIFLNGSGDDNCSFSRLKLHVLAALLDAPDCTDWQALLKQKCEKMYPVTGECVAEFIIKQEEKVEENGKVLPLYQGVATARDIYLDEETFTSFHNKLQELLPKAQGEEYQEMILLYRSLMLTRLEIKRLHADTTGCSRMLDELEEAKESGLRIYSESFWTLDDYIRDFRAMLAKAKEMRPKNQLQGIRLTALTPLDEEYSDISILTDGLTGLPSNYHCGHLISSADPALKIALPTDKSLKRLHIELIYNTQFHMALPLSVKLSAGDKEIAAIEPSPSDIVGRYVAEFDVPSSASGTLVLTFVRTPEERTMAIDEIMGW